jgi:hypothetical protein
VIRETPPHLKALEEIEKTFISGLVELLARRDWEMAVRIEKILCAVLHETHKQQVGETKGTISEGPEGLYKSCLD